MIGKSLFDERHHCSCCFFREKLLSRRRSAVCWKPLAIRPVIVPLATRRLIALHEKPMFAPHLAIKMFYTPTAAPGNLGGEPRTACEKAMIGTDFHWRASEGFPAFGHRRNAPFRRFRHHNAARAMSRNGSFYLGC